MSETIIKQIPHDDLVEQLAPLTRYAFYPSPPVDTSDFEKNLVLFDDCTVLGMYDGERVVGSAYALHMTQNVRGKLLSMGGVAGVTSMPTYRRRGHVKRLLVELFSQMNAQGMAVSTLYPFRESFYERLGYTTFLHRRRVSCNVSDLRSLITHEFPGTVTFGHQSDGWEEQYAFMREHQIRVHGMGFFADEAMNHLYGKKEWWFAHAYDENGILVGVMPYRITGFQGTFEVPYLYTQNSLARYLLLQYIARHIDQVTKLDILRLLPDERPETWLSDLNFKAEPDIWITPMGRVINVRGLAGISVDDDAVTLAISDKFCEWNNGVFTFSSEDGKLVITEKDVNTDVDAHLSINGLSALIFGTHDLHDFRWREWGQLSDATIKRLQMLFPMQAPYLFTSF
ncbi:MAG: GNAT family N-acetyltransferase [Chloroflexota bacterium]